MNAYDLAILRTFTRRTADVIDNVRRLARLQSGQQDPGPVLAEIEALEHDVEAFVDELADRESRSWGRDDKPPRFDAPERIAAQRPKLSSDVEPHARVERLGMDGRPQRDARDRPPTSGKWTKWRAEQKR